MMFEFTSRYSIGSVLLFALFGLLLYTCYVSVRKIIQKMSAWYIAKQIPYDNSVLAEEKHQIFSVVKKHQESLRRVVNLLDIGSGPAANLKFVPGNVSVVCFDSNPYFAHYIHEKLKKEEHAEPVVFVTGIAEKMPFEDNTFDVVVCSLVLCVVKDTRQSLEEIKRVLKPGGQFVFLEHILVKDRASATYLMQIASSFKMWLLYGCHQTRDTEFYIREAGFSDLCLNFVSHEENPLWAKLLMIGTATKQ